MRLIRPSINFLWMTEKPLLQIERAGRTCYKSEKGISKGSAKLFVQKLLDRGHGAMIEHASASYRVICDRGVTHEIVRHRLFSYAQESTRYCNYKDSVTFVKPLWLYEQLSDLTVVESVPSLDYYLETFPGGNAEMLHWLHAMAVAEIKYQIAIDNLNWTPQQARSVLPNSLKTEIVITGNLREWRHFFKLRTAKTAHPQMQEIANMLLKDIKQRIPVIYDDIGEQ